MELKKRYLIIGAGWSGATIANQLNANGNYVKVIEKENYVGGHSSSFLYKDVTWEPFGAHIFHTSNEKVAKFVMKYGMIRPYEHKVLIKASPVRRLSLILIEEVITPTFFLNPLS